MPGDGPASEFYYDGKTMMAYAPAENLVAVADAPPTIDAALMAAYNNGGHLLSVHRPARRGSVRRADRRRDPRVLHRSVGGGRRREDGHGGVGQQGRVPADLDRRRRQAAAAGARDLRRRSAAAAQRAGAFELAARSGDRAGHIRIAEGAGGPAHRIQEPGFRTAARASSRWSRCRQPRPAATKPQPKSP